MTDFDQTRLLALLPGAGDFEARLEDLRSQLAAGNEPILESTTREIEPIVEKYLKLKERKLYDYRVDLPPAPYTIAFVANPIIRKRQREASDPAFEPDPILNDLDLFLQTVNRGLASFEIDSVVGRPEIWSRIRVVTIFNEDARGEEFSLLEEFQEERVLDGARTSVLARFRRPRIGRRSTPTRLGTRALVAYRILG